MEGEVKVFGNLIAVEVAYAEVDRQFVETLHVEQTAGVIEVIEASRLREFFPKLKIDVSNIGIYGVLLDGTKLPKVSEYELKAGDRIEIYRPLIIDPKAARMARVEKTRNENRKK